MTIKHRWVITTLMAVSLLVVPTALVLAKSLSSLTISGPGIKGEKTLDEPEAMRKILETGFLFGEFSFAQKPDDLGKGYRMIAFLYLDGPTVPFVNLTYFPPLAGQPGLVHYTARLDGDGMQMQPVDDWRKIPSDVAEEVQAVLASQGVTLQVAASSNSSNAASTQPNPITGNEQSPSLNGTGSWLWATGWLAVAALTGFVLKRLTINQRQSTRD